MKVPQLKEKLDKSVHSLARFEEANFRGEKPLAKQFREDMKGFAVLAMEGVLEEVGQYGHNTHTYSAVQAFLIEFRNKV